MTTMTTPPPANDRLEQPSDVKPRSVARETFHLLVAAATWALFFYWWWLVLPQVRREDAVLAGALILVTALATAALTAAWVGYNLGIYRRKGPRLLLTPPVPARDSDALGRRIVRPDDASLRGAHVVVVAVDGDRKTFAPGGAD